jgi:hypothetical protein
MVKPNVAFPFLPQQLNCSENSRQDAKLAKKTRQKNFVAMSLLVSGLSCSFLGRLGVLAVMTHNLE